MNTPEQLPPPLYNVLPLRFRTWVACYNSLPESQRSESRFRFYEGVTKKQFARLYGYPQPTQVIGKVEYLIEREWRLARIGEELLPAHWTVTEWQQIKSAVRSAHALHLSEDELRIGNQAFSRLLKTLIEDQ